MVEVGKDIWGSSDPAAHPIIERVLEKKDRKIIIRSWVPDIIYTKQSNETLIQNKWSTNGFSPLFYLAR